jgi:4-aminobutyrate aminotransferase/(S)-3-amino-2-methylpropionate transaminase
VEVCEALAEITPGSHAKKSALFNSGAEAVENAVKIARVATGRDAVVVFDHAYHGRTNLTMAMTAKSMPYKRGFGPFAGEVYRAPMSYPFREPAPLTGEQAAQRATAKIEKEVGADQVACVVIEPVQGEGRLRRACARASCLPWPPGVVTTGCCWWLTRSSPASAAPATGSPATPRGSSRPRHHRQGHRRRPAAVGRHRPRRGHGRGARREGLGGTYGGNPLACAAALGAIETMRQLDLPGAARGLGELMLTRLRQLAERYPAIGDVRGRGAMVAIELVQPGTTEPDAALTSAVSAACHAAGVLTLTCGTYGNVLRFLPPLVMPPALLAEALDVLEQAFASHRRRLAPPRAASRAVTPPTRPRRWRVRGCRRREAEKSCGLPPGT